MNTQSRSNPCTGRKVPITVRKATADEFVFEVSRSKALTGCNDTLMEMRPVDTKTSKGTFSGQEFTLTRKD